MLSVPRTCQQYLVFTFDNALYILFFTYVAKSMHNQNYYVYPHEDASEDYTLHTAIAPGTTDESNELRTSPATLIICEEEQHQSDKKRQ